MPDLELLASRLGSAGLLEKTVCGFTKQEVDLLCRSVLEAYGEPLFARNGGNHVLLPVRPKGGQRLRSLPRRLIRSRSVHYSVRAVRRLDFLLPALLQCYGEKLGAFPTNST